MESICFGGDSKTVRRWDWNGGPEQSPQIFEGSR